MSIFNRYRTPALIFAVVVALGQQANTSLAAPNRPTATVKFRLVQGYLVVVPLSINGAGPFDFILDTGTNTTVVTQGLSRRLGLQAQDRTNLITVTGTKIVPRSRLAKLELGPKIIEAVEAIIADLPQTSSTPGIHGILGQNVLSQFNYLLDYRRRTLEFDEAGILEARLQGARLPVESVEGNLLVRIRVSGRAFRLALDTGTPVLVMFRAPGDRPPLTIDPIQGSMELRGVDGASRSDRKADGGVLPPLEIGGQTLTHCPVVFIQTNSRDEPRLEEGLLPLSFFRAIYFGKRFVVLNPELGR